MLIAWSLYFNPTLVQLEDFIEKPTHISETNFNPTLVQLEEAWKTLQTNSPLPNFNPTLVQLEAGVTIPRKTVGKDFNPTLVQLEGCKSTSRRF